MVSNVISISCISQSFVAFYICFLTFVVVPSSVLGIERRNFVEGPTPSELSSYEWSSDVIFLSLLGVLVLDSLGATWAEGRLYRWRVRVPSV